MKMVYLNEICTPKQWKTISRSRLLSEGYPVYGANGIIGYYSEYTHEKSTILITCRGATCGTINVCEPKSYVTGNAMALDNLISDVSLNYLKYTLITRGLDDVISGSAQPQITRTNLNRVQVPLPPLKTQEHIASILDDAAALRDKTAQLLEEYDLLAQSIFLEMFGDPAINQKGWEMKKFDDVGEIARGKSQHRPRNAPELLGGIYPLIQTGDIANSDGYIREYKSTYSEIGLAQSRLWPAGTLCITIAANIANTGILTMDACFPDSVVGFIPNEQTNNEFTQYWMSFLQKIIEANAPHVAQKNINLRILKELDFFCPPIELQNEFAEKIALIEQQKDLVRQELKESEDLFNCLLQKAFKGELVPESQEV